MKTILSLATLLFAFNVHAEVKLPGTIVESQCADAREINPRMGGYAVIEVCTGHITGMTGSYLFVTESRILRGGSQRQTTVWEISEKPSFSKVTEIGYRNEEGRFEEKAAGSHVTGSFKFTAGGMKGELGGRKFTATRFHTIFHTM
jgi:hypothetical protein